MFAENCLGFTVKSHLRPREGSKVNGSGVKVVERESQYYSNCLKEVKVF